MVPGDAFLAVDAVTLLLGAMFRPSRLPPLHPTVVRLIVNDLREGALKE